MSSSRVECVGYVECKSGVDGRGSLAICWGSVKEDRLECSTCLDAMLCYHSWYLLRVTLILSCHWVNEWNNDHWLYACSSWCVPLSFSLVFLFLNQNDCEWRRDDQKIWSEKREERREKKMMWCRKKRCSENPTAVNLAWDTPSSSPLFDDVRCWWVVAFWSLVSGKQSFNNHHQHNLQYICCCMNSILIK